MPISAVDAITPAFEHARQQLLRPFRAGQWAKLALVGLLAGEMGSGGGGGCNPGSFRMPHPDSSQRLLESALPSINPALTASLIAVTHRHRVGAVHSVHLREQRHALRALRQRCGEGVPHWAELDAAPGAGRRFFVWQILLALASIMGLTILIGIPAGFAFLVGWLREPKAHMVPLILGGLVLFFVLLLFVVVQLVVHVMTKDFVVPQMALEDIGAIEGWRRLWPRIKGEMGGYAAYIGMKIVMAIGAAIILGIVSAIVFLLFLIPVAGLGAVAVIGGMAAGLTWNLYTITLAVVVGSIAIFSLLYIMSLVSVPAVVFFPAYSIYFFAARYPALGAVLYPAPPPVVPPPPPDPPPLLPTPEPIG